MSESQQENNRSLSMTSEQRKSKYRNLLDKVAILQGNDETGLKSTEVLHQIIVKANTLFNDGNMKERINHTDEVLLDAQVVATASDVLLHITESIDCDPKSYDQEELAAKINSKFVNNDDPDNPDYTKLSKIANKILSLPPNFSFLYGEFGNSNAEAKPVKEKRQRSQRNKKEEQLQKKQPERITQISKEEESVDDTVKFLQWALNKEFEETNQKKLNYFNFIIDPTSYSSTIENLFHFSFLVRDGRAKIDVDKNGVLQIASVSHHDSKRAKKNGVPYKQSIISIDMEEWQAAIKTFNIDNCLLTKWKTIWNARKKEEI